MATVKEVALEGIENELTAGATVSGTTLLTVTEIVDSARLPARSYTLASKVWLPFATNRVSQFRLKGAALPANIRAPSL